MRVSPIALVYHRNPTLAIQYASRSSEVTHPYSTNSEACRIYTKLIVRALECASKEDIASDLTAYIFEDPDLRSRFEKYSDIASFQAISEQEISSSGYVVHSLEAALWAFFTTDSFEQGAFKVGFWGSFFSFEPSTRIDIQKSCFIFEGMGTRGATLTPKMSAGCQLGP